MTTTFLVRIETLEKKLDEYETRLDLEEKRRNILAKWIHLNFRNQNGQPNPVKPANQIRIKRKTARRSRDVDPLSPEIGAGGPNKDQLLLVQEIKLLEPTIIIRDDHYVGGNSDNFIPVESEDSESDSGVKKKPKIKNGQGNRSMSGGRTKDPVWKEFRTLPNPTCSKSFDAFCLKCGRKVSPKVERLKDHLNKCKELDGRSGTQIQTHVKQLNSILAETIQTSDQNNSGASVNVTVTQFPHAHNSSGQTKNSDVNEWS